MATPSGMSTKEIDNLAERLAVKLNLPDTDIKGAFTELVREDVRRIALNEIIKGEQK